MYIYIYIYILYGTHSGPPLQEDELDGISFFVVNARHKQLLGDIVLTATIENCFLFAFSKHVNTCSPKGRSTNSPNRVCSNRACTYVTNML